MLFLDNVTMITDTDKVSFFIIGDWGGLPVFPYKYFIIPLNYY